MIEVAGIIHRAALFSGDVSVGTECFTRVIYLSSAVYHLRMIEAGTLFHILKKKSYISIFSVISAHCTQQNSVRSGIYTWHPIWYNLYKLLMTKIS